MELALSSSMAGRKSFWHAKQEIAAVIDFRPI
jgi:hypothetical protein